VDEFDVVVVLDVSELHKAEAEDRMVVSDQNRTQELPLGLSPHGCASFLCNSRVLSIALRGAPMPPAGQPRGIYRIGAISHLV
jgi:hypothetical protein